MSERSRHRGRTPLRRLGAALLFVPAASLPAQAQFLPEGFFATLPEPGAPAEVEANTLAYDSRTDVISAEGRVVLHYAGYTVACDRLRYDQKSSAMVCEGHAQVLDPQGTLYEGERMDVTGGMKEAVIQSMTLTTRDGARITARNANYAKELQTVLDDATYTPCGDCIDDKGNRIGWKVKAVRFIQDKQTNTVYLEQPILEVLGVPVAWLPWLSMPDPSAERSTGFLLPSFNYDENYGGRVTAPYFIAAGKDTDILLNPALMSRQGFLMAAEWQQRFDYGWLTVKGSGIYQLDPGAYAGTVGDRDWRGAIQSSGRFEVAEDWTAGWSYTAFTDAAYLDDYDFDDSGLAINEVYAEHLSEDFYADFRLQEYLKLGNVTEAAQDQQVLAVPNARGNGYFDLGDMGQVRASGNLLGLSRDADQATIFNGVPYVLGYEGDKVHAMGEVSWQNQLIAPGGIVATPYLGLRVDATEYSTGSTVLDDGPGGYPDEPSDQFLFSATPVAAMDFRWPLIASSGLDTHLLEPIAQLVYRGSDETAVGVTNDNAHSFVLDDTNMFSYDRFSGTDRQETGLRANIGARYLANFSQGAWLELMAGQSFQLAGVNAFAEPDQVNAGLDSGMDEDASYVVLGARGSPTDGVTLGAKMQLDTDQMRVARAGFGGSYAIGDFSFGADYLYQPATPATGVVADQQEVTLRATTPLPLDYWKAITSLSWDIAQNEFLEARGELLYDDGYFLAGGFAQKNGPTHETPDSVSFGVKFFLKAPGGSEFGFGY